MYKFYNWRLQHPTADGGGSSDGAKGAGADDADGGDDGDEDEGTDEADDDDGDSESPKNVTMTQDELDALINKAFKRGARRASRDNRAKAAPPADDGQDDGKADPDAVARAAAVLSSANAKLLAATVKSMGADMAISAKGLKVAERFIDMDDCVGADGEIDEEAVEDALEEFIKEYPEFKTGGGKKPGVKQFEGNPKGSGAKMSKEDIMKIKDPAKRRKAIADNIDLFK